MPVQSLAQGQATWHMKPPPCLCSSSEYGLEQQRKNKIVAAAAFCCWGALDIDE